MLRKVLVLAVLIGVVLSQQQDRTRNRGRPRIRGSAPAPLGEISGAVRIGRARTPSRTVSRRPAAPRPIPPPPPPPTTTTPPPPPPTQPEYDYDYVYIDDLDQDLTLLANPIPTPKPTPAPRPPPPTASVFRPVPAPRRPSPQPSSRPPPPRRSNVGLANIDQDFSLQNKEQVRGRKEPEVKILRSWSHQNSDGTFSWGYINTDGSFKNETKGVDCVVHGVYGYVDKDTGEQVSFPYQSGNPCDPDAPDYYYDYDTNTMIMTDADGKRGPAPRRPPASGPRSRLS